MNFSDISTWHEPTFQLLQICKSSDMLRLPASSTSRRGPLHLNDRFERLGYQISGSLGFKPQRTGFGAVRPEPAHNKANKVKPECPAPRPPTALRRPSVECWRTENSTSFTHVSLDRLEFQQRTDPPCCFASLSVCDGCSRRRSWRELRGRSCCAG